MSWIDENGISIESPRGDEPPTSIQEMRATILFWRDLMQAGVPVRSIAACFGVHHKVVLDHVHSVPESARMAHVSQEYLGRLRAAVAEGRRTGPGVDVRVVVQILGATHLLRRPPLPTV